MTEAENVSIPRPGCELAEILITEELTRRPFRKPDYEGECKALVALAAELAESPPTILKKLADLALSLTAANSSGISLADKRGDEDIFRWHATAGEFSRYAGGSMPRNFSPCGTVLDMKQSLLMRDPVRYYPHIANFHLPVREALLVPFSRGDVMIGTVWIIAHNSEKNFDAEDERIIASLARFASAAAKTLADAKLLSESNQRKTEFLATLAHELRNPLAPIQNGLEILKKSTSAETNQKVLALIGRQTAQMSHLIDDLMDIARIATGKIELRSARVDLGSTINNALEEIAASAGAAKHKISPTLPKTPLFVIADATRLSQVMANVVANAIKYTPTGGNISIILERDTQEAIIRVEDDGIGISSDQLEPIFEMFTQVDHTMNRPNGGLGIGLAISRTIVEMHGGRITVESEGLGKGSAFIVRLPLCDDQAEPLSSAAKSEPDSNTRTLRILIVEDNEDGAESLALLLGSFGHQVKTAHSAAAGIAAAEHFQLDIAFLDIGLPDMTGYDLARALRGRLLSKQATLVAMTGWGSSEDKRKASEAGFDFHLTKPARFDDLNHILSKAAEAA